MQEPEPRQRRLGRGLFALIGRGPVTASGEPIQAAVSNDLRQIPVEAIERNPFQPRQDFDEQALRELVESIYRHGVLQPLLVRRHEDGFQLIAGERRWLASKAAGLDTVPCQVCDLDDRGVFAVAIEENLKRKDLNVLEKAQAFRDYVDRFGCSIEELARQISTDRSTVSNYLRLLDLAEPVKESLRAGQISNGHARALLPLKPEDQVTLCLRIAEESLSVRATESAVRAYLRGQPTVRFPTKGSTPTQSFVTNHVRELESQLQQLVGGKVTIRLRSKESGQIVIPFGSNDEFERIMQLFRRAA